MTGHDKPAKKATTTITIRPERMVISSPGQGDSPGLVRLGRRFWRTHHLRRPAAEAPEFPNALVIDLPEATLLPGPINMHTHPSYSWEEPDSGTYTYSPEKIKV